MKVSRVHDLIVIAGAPGTGKTTVGNLLHASLRSPYIDFGFIREFHLDRDWKDESEREEQMSFENLIYIIRNYVRHGYRNVIVTDLKDFRVRQIPEQFSDLNYLIVTLMVENDNELERRIRGRNDGFRDAEKATAWNRNVRERERVTREFLIDNSHNDPVRTHDLIMKILTDDQPGASSPAGS